MSPPVVRGARARPRRRRAAGSPTCFMGSPVNAGMAAFDGKGLEREGARVRVGGVGNRAELNRHLSLVDVCIGIPSRATVEEPNMRVSAELFGRGIVREYGVGRNRSTDKFRRDRCSVGVPEIQLQIVGEERVNVSS